MRFRVPVLVTLSLVALLLVALPGSSAALAQTAPIKVGVVDVQRVLTESAPGRQRTASIESLQQQLQSQGEALRGEIQQLRTRIADREGAGAADAELGPMRQELEQKTAELRQFGDDANRQLSKRSNDVLREFEGIVMPILEAIGAEGGYTLLFRKYDSGFVYVAPSVDITDQVIARVNASGPGGSP